MKPTEAGPWTENNFVEMETELGQKIPASYREFMLERAVELSELTYPFTWIDDPQKNSEISWFEDMFFGFNPEFIASRNMDFRSSKSMVGHAFPNWWNEFFIFATNGGSGMYALRLDGESTVWLMECDGGRMEAEYQSINEMVQDSLHRYHHNLPLHQKEREWFDEVQKGKMTNEEYKERSNQLDFWY